MALTPILSVQDLKKEALNQLSVHFGDTIAPRVFFAPGRINLIGEHTDYNGGHVFPFAICLGTVCAIQPNSLGLWRFYSHNFPDLNPIVVPVGPIDSSRPAWKWANYPLGIFKELQSRNIPIPPGLDMVFFGNLPNGSGLSSSACLEVLTATVLLSLSGHPMSGPDIATMAQHSENTFNHVSCGIMDQFVIACGQENKALFLDTATLQHKALPLNLGSARVLIMNTNKPRSLITSKYNERRAECEEALRRLQKKLPIQSLGDLDTKTFEDNTSLIHDPVLERRARHAVTENQRTIAAIDALQKNDIPTLCQLINASGDSLRYDYEVTGDELDCLVDAARAEQDVLCARMTGAGFGGCAIALAEADQINRICDHIHQKYIKKIGYAPSFFQSTAQDGPKEI